MKVNSVWVFACLLAGMAILIFAGCTSLEPEVVEPVEPTVQEEAPEPEPVPEEAAEEGTEDFVVTQEIYEKTFEDVEALIDRLNTIIRNENFEEWNTYLTDQYREHYSDPAVLKDISEDLRKKYRYELRLRSLRDYFLYIVVGSREEATLDKIEFIDENHLLAYSIVNDTPVILYYLANDGEGWKIALWQ